MLTIKGFVTKQKPLLYILAVFIIAVITLIPMFSHAYFTMHDDQHVARLYLLDQAINQGTLYPRWVDQLGFGYGYPLYNFYPPLIYYVAEVFASVGLGYITSVKLMLVVGSIVGAFGVFMLAKRLYGSNAGIIATMLFCFFSYRAITLYIRGAFAEYWALSIMPWVLFAIYNLYKNSTHKNALLAGLTMALLMLAHPFVAVPGGIYITASMIMFFIAKKEGARTTFFIYALQSIIIAAGLSAFFWLPSMIERSHTLVDTILLRELASYSIHFVYPQQLWYSPWGFGGSVAGLGDGLSFQISKPYILFFIASSACWLLCRKAISKRVSKDILYTTIYFFAMLLVSVFFMLPYSKVIWDNIAYLQYLQFPWRFMAFVALFLSLFCASLIWLLENTTRISDRNRNNIKLAAITFCILLVTIVQSKYFAPQRFINTTDTERTTFKEIAWRISSSSFEFVPKGVRTKKTQYNTTTLDIDEKQVNSGTHDVLQGEAKVELLSNRFDHKRFSAQASTPLLLQFHTFHFPGWEAYINGIKTDIDSTNEYRLIRINVPSGRHSIDIKYTATPVQRTASWISVIAWFYFFSYMYLTMGSLDSRKQAEKIKL